MRIAILGTGALGCLFAARLAAHAEVWMLGTWSEALAAVRERGVRIHNGQGVATTPVRTATDPGAVPAADLALILVKSYQTERAASWAARCLAPGGLAVTLQNGLGNLQHLRAAVGTERAVAGVTFEGATVLAPGEIRHAGSGPTHVGARPATAARVGHIVALLESAGFEADAVSDIDSLLWGKALVNAAINPLSALWRIPNGELLAAPERRSLLAALALEVANVAAARHIALPFVDPVGQVETVCRATAANRSSMLQDVERGRPTEIDSINGVIVCEGQRRNVPVPTNEIVWRLVRAM